jgi:hypothetical protein
VRLGFADMSGCPGRLFAAGTVPALPLPALAGRATVLRVKRFAMDGGL